MKRLVVVAALTLAASALAAPPTPDGNNLKLTGALRTSSAKVVAPSSGCSVRKGTLTFQSGAMRLRSGPRVARVIIELRRFHGRGAYNATTRPVRRWAPVQVITAKNAAKGVGSRWFYARRGSVIVERVSYAKGDSVSARGRVGAVLTEGGARLGHGKPTVQVRGAWACYPVAN